MKAWHFIRADRRLRFGDGREVKVGETLHYEGTEPLELCKKGMHASVRLLDALSYAPGLTLCEVEISGDVLIGDDKIAGRSRRVLRMIDATALVVEFANMCAGRATKHAARADAADAARYAARAYAAADAAARYAAADAAARSADAAARYAAAAAYVAAAAARYAADAAKAHAAAAYARYAADAVKAHAAAAYVADAAARYAADAAYQHERDEQEKILTALVESAFAAHENAGQ